MHRVLAVLVSAAALAGCSSPSAPDDAPDVALAFGINRLQAEAPFVADGGEGSAVVRGYFVAPCSPYEARAEVEAGGGGLLLDVVGENRGDCPMDVVLPYGYQATISGLRPGTYPLRVRHRYRDTNWLTEVVFTAEVVVR